MTMIVVLKTGRLGFRFGFGSERRQALLVLLLDWLKKKKTKNKNDQVI